MILTAIVLFCLAALLGLWLVVLGVRYRRGSRALAAGHAGVALLGLILLGKHIFSSPVHMLYNNAALLFVLALFGGLVLLALRMGNHEHRSPPPMIGVSFHAAVANHGVKAAWSYACRDRALPPSRVPKAYGAGT
jgi:hypothetical protein